MTDPESAVLPITPQRSTKSNYAYKSLRGMIRTYDYLSEPVPKTGGLDR